MRALVLFVPLLLTACGQSSGMIADAGSDAPSSCPASPPADGDGCTGTPTCHWLRCDEDGAVSASCTAGAWDVATRPCPIDCMGTTCAPGQICAVFQSGAQRFECVDDPCDGAALESCLCDVCPGGDPARCSRNAFTVTCNTCFADICA